MAGKVTVGLASQTLMAIHLRAHCLEEGDEHPPKLSCGAWLAYLTLHRYLTYIQSLDGVAPAYLIDDCRLLSDASRRPLRSSSSDIRTLVIPRAHNKFGDRSFLAAGPRVWNDLPSGLRQPGLSFATFRRQLKTFLFSDRSA